LPESQNAQKKFIQYLSSYDLILDGVFGFSFTGELRVPYSYFLPQLRLIETKIVSIDVPSGWDSNKGNINKLFTPKYLISLIIPKKCSHNFEGEHYLGGRFIPKKIAK
jgi:NAD(P)H-hydrate epimerase